MTLSSVQGSFLKFIQRTTINLLLGYNKLKPKIGILANRNNEK
jgi:hypothetical protein